MTALSEVVAERNLAEVEAAVPLMDIGDGLSARDVWVRIDKWALHTVRHMLNRLASDGRVIREPGGDLVLYRRSKVRP